LDKIEISYFDSEAEKPIFIANSTGLVSLSDDNINNVLMDLSEKVGFENTQKMVFAIPGAFNYTQRRMIVNYAKENGMIIRRLIHRSSAVALAYYYELSKKKVKEDRTIVLCIFDNGLFEIAIAELWEGVIEMKAIDWDNNFNADNFDIEKCNLLFHNIMLVREKQIIKEKMLSGENVSGVKFTVEDIDEVLLITNDVTYSKIKSLLLNFFKKEPNVHFNTEYSITHGATIQGRIIDGYTRDMLLLELGSISVWVKIGDDSMINVIDKNAVIPAYRSVPFSITKSDSLNIKIYQGANENTAQDQFLGDILLYNINRGDYEIILTIDSDFILCVIIRNTLTKEEVYKKIFK